MFVCFFEEEEVVVVCLFFFVLKKLLLFICFFCFEEVVVVCFCLFLSSVTRDAVRARGVTRGGSRTRQLAQAEKQIAVVLMPLIPFFVRDG